MKGLWWGEEGEAAEWADGQPGGLEGAMRRGCNVLGRGDPAGAEGLAGGIAGGGAQEGELGACRAG